MYKRQLPKTIECINKIENIYEKFITNYDAISEEEKEQTDDYIILMNPMARLAETFYAECKSWAVDLAKHIAVMNGDHYIDKEIKIKFK